MIAARGSRRATRRRPVRAALIAAIFAFVGPLAAAQAPPTAEEMLAEAARIVREASAVPAAPGASLRAAGFAEAARLLDRIVDEHPGSDAAVSILLGEPVGGLDPAAIRAAAASVPVPPFVPPETLVSPAPPSPVAPEAAVAAPPAIVPAGPSDQPDVERVAAPSPEAAPVAAPAAPPQGPAARPDARPVVPPAPEEASAPIRSPAPVSPGAAPPPGAAPSSAATEAALRLSGVERREIQRRLALIGFDPRGVDGLFGPGSRDAIARWQGSRGFSATGYLDAGQLAALRRQSARAYAGWNARAGRPPPARPAPEKPRGRYVDEDGCLREDDGRYVPGFRFGCG